MSRRLNATIATTLALTGAISACAADEATVLEPSQAATKTTATGTVGLAITLGDGVTVDAVSYTVTAVDGQVVASDDIRVSDPSSTVSVRLGLPVGAGYTIRMSAETHEGARCAGSARFDVSSGVTQQVYVDLVCGTTNVNTELGSAEVIGQIAETSDCASLAFYSVSPLRASVGGSIALAGAANPSATPVTYSWAASSGTVANPAAAETTFTCTEAGAVTLTFGASDADGCGSSTALEVECVGVEAPLEVPGRLTIADAVTGDVRVLDPASGEIIGTFALAGPASLNSTESGRFVAAVQSAASQVDFIDVGLELEDHGDHTHSYEHTPRKLGLSIVGSEIGSSSPSHFVAHHGWLTVHFDGRFDAAAPATNLPAKNIVLPEAELLRDPAVVSWVLSTEPQHGVSVPTDDGYLIFSQPSLDRARSALPSGFAVHSLEDGGLVQTINDGDDFTSSCWGMHGEAVVGESYLFGCHEALDGGLLVIEWDEAAGEFVSRKITYPGYPNASSRTSVIEAHAQSAWGVGQWGFFGTTSQYRGLVRIDPAAEAITQADVIDLGAVYCGFDFERSQGEKVAVLTQDGRLRIIDVPSWTVESVAQVLPDTSASGTCAGSLATGEGVVFVSNGSQGTVSAFSVDDLGASTTWNVPGNPGSLAVSGFWAPVAAPH